MSDVQHTLITKICTRCKAEKPATTEYFGKKSTGKFGLRADCKQCRHGEYIANHETNLARQLQYAAKNREKERQRARLWRAKHPDYGQLFRKTYYQKNQQEICEKQRIYRAANREKVNAKINAYWRARPRERSAKAKRHRARIYAAAINDFTHAQWLAMQGHYDHRCVYCGKRRKGKLTQDHITPLSKGGNHTASNIVPACRSCNSKKQAGSPLTPVQPLLLVCG